jgi:hypothetical protein
MPSLDIVTDAKGEPLQTGDSVRSLKIFDAAHTHRGVVEEIDVTRNRITIRHKDCCETGHQSEDCEPRCWKKVTRRPTAWEKILQDD